MVDPSRYRFTSPAWQLTYWAPADSCFTLNLTLPRDAKPILELTRQMPGLPTLPGMSIPPRPPNILPGQTGDISVVYRRVTF